MWVWQMRGKTNSDSGESNSSSRPARHLSSCPQKKHVSFSLSLLVEGVLGKGGTFKGLAHLSFKSQGEVSSGIATEDQVPS